jgi:hypothetical protein
MIFGQPGRDLLDLGDHQPAPLMQLPKLRTLVSALRSHNRIGSRRQNSGSWGGLPCFQHVHGIIHFPKFLGQLAAIAGVVRNVLWMRTKR